MRRWTKLVACAVAALAVGAIAQAVLAPMLEPPEIRRWEATGVLRFDHPVSETYAREINREVREEALRQDIIRRSDLPQIVKLAVEELGRVPGLLLDPLQLAIEGAVFAAAWFALPRVRPRLVSPQNNEP